MTATTSDHLELFRTLFPLTSVMVCEDEIRYKFRNEASAAYFDNMAQKIILDNLLRVTATLETWEAGGYVFEIVLRVEYAPEMYLIER